MTSLIVYRASDDPLDTYLASDLLHMRGDYASPLSLPKWYRLQNWAFAVAGDHRVSSVLQRAHRALTPPASPPTPDTLAEFVFMHLSEAGKDLSSPGHDGHSHDTHDTHDGWPRIGASILWAHPIHGAFCMDHLGAIVPIPPDCFEVTGSARDVLAGALSVALDFCVPHTALERTLEAAERYHLYSRGIYVVSLQEFLAND